MYLGKATAQNPAMCIAYIRNMSEDTKLVLTRTILHKYAKQALGQHLGNSIALQAPISLCNSYG